MRSQWPCDAPPSDLPARKDIRANRNEGIPTTKTGSGGDTAYRERMGS